MIWQGKFLADCVRRLLSRDCRFGVPIENAEILLTLIMRADMYFSFDPGAVHAIKEL
jgi:hypothetical protein